jgi:hypothetical protein
MAAIDSDVRVFVPTWQFGRRKTTLALIGAAAALAVALATFVMEGRDINAMRASAMMVFRASSAAFLLFYLAGPISRLIRTRPTVVLARERTGLALAFAAMYAVFLACLIAPDVLVGTRIPLANLTFAAFSSLILVVVLMGERAALAESSWRSALRTMEVVGVAYFWAAYAVNDLDHLSGPHRPDGYYGASLTVLCVALLVRFADAFWQRYRLARG